MATFTQTFTLKDIFNNKNLKNKLPLINYKEKETENGKISVRTAPKTVRSQVFNISTQQARPFYKPLVINKLDNKIIFSGELVGDQDACVEQIYNALVSNKFMLSYTANNTDMIRDALKESEKNQRLYGKETKLYLRAKSMQEIEGMSKKQVMALMENVMENIIYGDDFPKTQNKYKVEEMIDSYNAQKLSWKYRVGD